MPLELLIPVATLNCYVISQPVCDLLMVIMTEIVTKQIGIGTSCGTSAEDMQSNGCRARS